MREVEVVQGTYNTGLDNSRRYTKYAYASFGRQPLMENTAEHHLQFKCHPRFPPQTFTTVRKANLSS